MRKIITQSGLLILAHSVARIIGFFYTIFLARTLGVSDFGLYSVSLAYLSLISAVADFGFNRFLIREVARDHQKIPELLCNVGSLRLTLTVVLFAIFALGLYFLDPDKMRVHIGLLAVMSVLPQSISFTIDAIFVALQRLQLSSFALVSLSLATTFFGIFLVSSGFGPIGAVVALILGQLIYLIILIVIYKIQNLKVLSKVNWPTIKHVIFGSLPYGLLGILGLLYFRIDILMLTYLRGNFDAGIYGVAFRFLEAVVFIPSALSFALFPIFAKLHLKYSSQIRPIYFFSVKLMVLLGLIIALCYILVLPTIVRLFLPNYLSSIEVIKILALAIPLMFVHIPGAQVLLASEKYLKQVLLLSFVTVIFKVILNLIFIPQYGFIATAWITVASEALSLIIFFSLLWIKVLA